MTLKRIIEMSMMNFTKPLSLIIVKKFIFLFGTFNTVIIIFKGGSKMSSFRHRFQEHLLKFLMLAVTDSE
jgi:hypothetical protein